MYRRLGHLRCTGPGSDLIKTIPEPYRGQLPYPGTAADLEAFEKAAPAAHAAVIQSIPGSKLVPVPNTTHKPLRL